MPSTTQEAKAASTEVKPEEKVLLMHVSDVQADFAWNARSGEWWKDVDEEEKLLEEPKTENGSAETAKPKKGKAPRVDDRTNFGRLRKSILETGTNEQPVLCRQPAKVGGKPRLVCGFMRYRAVSDLARDAKNGGPTDAQRGLIRVVVREMNDQQARISNIRENTSRDDLKGPDLCWSVGETIKQYGFSDTTLAASLGKSQGYVSKLHRIYDRLSPKVLDMWRNAPIPVTIDQIQSQVIMMIGKNADPDNIPNEEDQLDYFKRVLEERLHPGSGRGPDGWMETKIKAATELGELLGLLQGAGIIKVVENDSAITVTTAISLPPKYKKLELKKKSRFEKSFIAAFDSGVEAGLLKAQEQEDELEEDDEDIEEENEE